MVGELIPSWLSDRCDEHEGSLVDIQLNSQATQGLYRIRDLVPCERATKYDRARDRFLRADAKGALMAVGGGSADRKAEELAASGDASAGAWAAGAAGERRVADELAGLSESWTVLHDRLLSPGLSLVNLDHVVVGPGGVYFVDAKNWRGAITAWEGNLYQHTGGAGARQSVSKHQEVAKVHGMGAYMAAESGLAVTPVICLAGHHEGEFGEAQLIRGVWVLSASTLAAWLRSRPVLL